MSAGVTFASFNAHPGRLLVVQMDQANILFKGVSSELAIGTQGLNGCTAIVVCGREAIILAHVSPYPSGSPDILRASHNHHAAYLDFISSAVRESPGRFSSQTVAWGIFSISGNNQTSWPIIQQVEGRLQALGIHVQRSFYQEVNLSDWAAPKGEVIGGFNAEGNPELWLEGRKIWTASSAPTPSRRIWQGFQIERDASGQLSMSCQVNGAQTRLQVRFPAVNGLPQVRVGAVWIHTQANGSGLSLQIQKRHGGYETMYIERLP